jgi:hypothetical protein
MTLSFLIASVAAYPGHNLHHGVDYPHEPRQDGGAPFAGIEMLSTSSLNTLPTLTRTSRLTFEPPLTRPTGPTTYISIGTSSIGPIPVTIIPVALATICSPGSHPTPLALNTSIGSIPSSLDPNNEAKFPAAATEVLRLNFTEVNDSSALIPTFTAYDGFGCSTLYIRTSSAICLTVLSGLGSLPVSVTACSQPITFPTSTVYGPVPTAANSNHSAYQGERTRVRLAYFIAPWYDIADGRLPSFVLVRSCTQKMGAENCDTATESWSVVNQTTSTDMTRSLAFDGTVTGVGV